MIARKELPSMEKEVKCPWCGELGNPQITVVSKALGNVIERRCTKCGQVLAAYLEQEGEFLPKIRTF